MSAKPLARYAALNNVVELSRTLGLDPAALLREAGLDPAGVSLPDRWVPAEAIAALLERAAAASGREDFGLRLAELRRFANLGPLSVVVREEPDVRSAVRLLIRYEHMYNEALHIRLHEQHGLATLRIELDLPAPQLRQSAELAVGVLHQLLRAFLGPTWQPLAVGFTHPAPRGATIHHRALGPAVRFEQNYDGLCVYTTDLDAPNTMADPQMRGYAQQFLDSIAAAKQATTAHRVRELIEILLPTGRCSIEQTARSLGVDRRTIHRRLAAEGQTFTTLLNATRRGLARRLVANPNQPLTEIAQMLAFSSHSNFTRWFRSEFGTSPSQWRRRPDAHRTPSTDRPHRPRRRPNRDTPAVSENRPRCLP